MTDSALDSCDPRFDFMESSNRWCLFALDLAASMAHIHGRLSYTRNPGTILEEAQKYLKRLLVDFDATGFCLVDETDQSFVLADCWPANKRDELALLVDSLIENGEFAWALNQNKTVIARTATQDGNMIILHVLATQSRVRGMFVAILGAREEAISRPMDNLLTIILRHTSHALEGAELYRLLDDSNLSLEQRVRDAMVHIMKQKQELQTRLMELQKTKDSLAQAKEAADGANRAKSAFLATISHEIRTPMNAIIGMNQLLLDANLPPQERQYAKIAARAGESLMTLINDILDISKIDANQLAIKLEPFDLHAILGDIMEVLAISATDKGIALKLEVDPAINRPLLGDAARLRQVLFNLGVNAIKFTPQGQVSIAVKKEAADRILFAITDTGIGIALEHLENIFEPFTQVDSSHSKSQGGTGLGLSICRRLLDLMGGRIWVESQANRGSVFQFTLPLPMAEAVPVPPVLPPVTPLPGTLHILLVEDSEDNRALIQAFLRKTPHTLETAENGREGLRMAQTGQYDLILMDMQMPIMDGFEATRCIREWEQQQGRPPYRIIALTAYAMPEDWEAIRQAGCDRHLTKPVSKAVFLEALQP